MDNATKVVPVGGGLAGDGARRARSRRLRSRLILLALCCLLGTAGGVLCEI